MDISAIVTVTVNIVTQGITAEAATQSAGSNNTTPTNISPLKIFHLRMICEVATDGEIPTIWQEVANATTKQVGLALLVQYLMGGMSVCPHDFLWHSELLHYSVPLYNFVAGDWFVIPGENPVCPVEGGLMWTSL